MLDIAYPIYISNNMTPVFCNRFGQRIAFIHVLQPVTATTSFCDVTVKLVAEHTVQMQLPLVFLLPLLLSLLAHLIMVLVECVIVLLELQLQQVLAQMEGKLTINGRYSVTSVAYDLCYFNYCSVFTVK